MPFDYTAYQKAYRERNKVKMKAYQKKYRALQKEKPPCTCCTWEQDPAKRLKQYQAMKNFGMTHVAIAVPVDNLLPRK